MSNNQVVLLMSGDALTSGLPVVTKPENLDAWPSKEATQIAFETITHIVNRGFNGVRFDTYPIADGQRVFNLLFNEDTPEGRMVQVVLASARQGKSLPVDEWLAILERVYREKGISVPKKQIDPADAGALKGALP